MNSPRYPPAFPNTARPVSALVCLTAMKVLPENMLDCQNKYKECYWISEIHKFASSKLNVSFLYQGN